MESIGYELRFNGDPENRPTMTNETRRFRVGLSFAGEVRSYVEEVAMLLAQRFAKGRILYDKFHQAEFSRRDLGFHLPELYHEQCDLIVVVVCPDYDLKDWCGLEWAAIHDLLKQRRDNDVMLARFKRANARGLYGNAGFIDLDDVDPTEFELLINERLEINGHSASTISDHQERGPESSINPPQVSKTPAHTAEVRRRDTITDNLKRMESESVPGRITIALDFCSFGAFGDFPTFERQLKLIKSIAQRLYANYDDCPRILANSPAACKWQLEDYFSNEAWEKNAATWKKRNIRRFATYAKSRGMCSPDTLARINDPELDRDNWIKFRLSFEKYIEDDLTNNNVSVMRFPGIVPFHAWLCEFGRKPSYGVIALCHHQTAASAEVVFPAGEQDVHDISRLLDNLVDAKRPPPEVLEQGWGKL